MSDVDDLYMRRHVAQHAFHHSDELIRCAVVGEQGDGVVRGCHGGPMLRVKQSAKNEQGWCRPPDGTSPVDLPRKGLDRPPGL
jgi:hypothetical protein